MPEIGDTRPSNGEADFRPRTCFNYRGAPKVRYYSRKEAKAALKKMPKVVQGKNMRENAKVYRCEKCHLFHIGHNR